MTFAVLEGFQTPEAFRPTRFQQIPDKSKLVQTLLAL